MARGAKKTYDDQLEQLNIQISKAQDRIDILLKEKENILTKKRETEIGRLYEYLQETDLSVDEVIGLINSEKNSEDILTA